MELHTIGIDLGKTVFHLVGLNLRGEVVVRKKFSRTQLLRFTANVHVGLIGMEACGGSHFLGRALREQRHEVRLIPAQYVKPYVKTNKSDYIDAEAIAEAVSRPTMRFVPIKTDDQLDLQSLRRVRERWVMRRTAVINQIRGLLLERGITLRKGRCYVGAALPGILEDADANLSCALRMLLASPTEAGARSPGYADRGSRCADQKDCSRKRSLSKASGHPGHRAGDGHRSHRGHRQRRGLPQGARVRSLDGGRSARTLHRWPAEAARDQQTWELLLAKTVRARRTCGPATAHEAVFRSECVVGPAH
jgi:transposase